MEWYNPALKHITMVESGILFNGENFTPQTYLAPDELLSRFDPLFSIEGHTSKLDTPEGKGIIIKFNGLEVTIGQNPDDTFSTMKIVSGTNSIELAELGSTGPTIYFPSSGWMVNPDNFVFETAAGNFLQDIPSSLGGLAGLCVKLGLAKSLKDPEAHALLTKVGAIRSISKGRLDGFLRNTRSSFSLSSYLYKEFASLSVPPSMKYTEQQNLLDIFNSPLDKDLDKVDILVKGIFWDSVEMFSKILLMGVVSPVELSLTENSYLSQVQRFILGILHDYGLIGKDIDSDTTISDIARQRLARLRDGDL